MNGKLYLESIAYSDNMDRFSMKVFFTEEAWYNVAFTDIYRCINEILTKAYENDQISFNLQVSPLNPFGIVGIDRDKEDKPATKIYLVQRK